MTFQAKKLEFPFCLTVYQNDVNESRSTAVARGDWQIEHRSFVIHADQVCAFEKIVDFSRFPWVVAAM